MLMRLFVFIKLINKISQLKIFHVYICELKMNMTVKIVNNYLFYAPYGFVYSIHSQVWCVGALYSRLAGMTHVKCN